VWDIKQQRQMADLTPLGGPRDMPAILTILLMARVPLGGGRHQKHVKRQRRLKSMNGIIFGNRG
jgi:hypothetical protein